MVFISPKLPKCMVQLFDSVLFAHCPVQVYTAMLFLVSGLLWGCHPPVLNSQCTVICCIRNSCLSLRKAIGLSSTTEGRAGKSQSSYRKRLRNELYILPNCKLVYSTTQLSLVRLTISCEIPRHLFFALKYCWESFGILTLKLAVWCWRMDPSEMW